MNTRISVRPPEHERMQQERLIMLYSVKDTADALSIGRTSVYELIKRRKLDVVKLGRRTLIKVSSIENLINQAEVIE
jgi:excisionase family DNA binding protein